MLLLNFFLERITLQGTMLLLNFSLEWLDLILITIGTNLICNSILSFIWQASPSRPPSLSPLVPRQVPPLPACSLLREAPALTSPSPWLTPNCRLIFEELTRMTRLSWVCLQGMQEFQDEPLRLWQEQMVLAQPMRAKSLLAFPSLLAVSTKEALGMTGIPLGPAL